LQKCSLDIYAIWYSYSTNQLLVFSLMATKYKDTSCVSMR
jgi:hypothetical protein